MPDEDNHFGGSLVWILENVDVTYNPRKEAVIFLGQYNSVICLLLITESATFLIISSTIKYKKKKSNINKKPSVRESTSDCHSYSKI